MTPAGYVFMVAAIVLAVVLIATLIRVWQLGRRLVEAKGELCRHQNEVRRLRREMAAMSRVAAMEAMTDDEALRDFNSHDLDNGSR